MTTHQTQAHDLIMKFYLSEKIISKAMAKRLALAETNGRISEQDKEVLEPYDVGRIDFLHLIKTEIENYNFKK